MGSAFTEASRRESPELEVGEILLIRQILRFDDYLGCDLLITKLR